jgi:uncharacterized protein
MIDEFCFFEIPGDDLDKLQEFYGTMFDWSFEKAPGAFRYHVIHTPGNRLKGGLTARQDPEHALVNYVKVASAEESLAKAVKLGATVVVPRKPVPGIGWYAVIKDPEGNRLGLWEDDVQAR